MDLLIGFLCGAAFMGFAVSAAACRLERQRLREGKRDAAPEGISAGETARGRGIERQLADMESFTGYVPPRRGG